ncbi:MAG: methyltransferase [Legionellaceae bacterium]|nr:methyltransferase [Legionellaceae bacterium]
MSLNKAQAKQHAQACELLEKDTLTFNERCFVIENFHEGGDSNNKHGSAHFTPYDLANDFKLDVHGPRVLDLCAGIGVLAFAYLHGWDHGERLPQLVCVEMNPRYVEVGRKVLPEAEWIHGDIFDPDIQAMLKERDFTSVISNPPFGKNAMRGRKAPRYKGGLFEYALMDIASDLASYGAFIIPQGSAPFFFSGVQCYQDCRHPLPNDPQPGQAAANMKKYQPFTDATGIDLQAGAGVDTSIYRDEWRGVSPAVEIVTAEFDELQQARVAAEAEEPEQLDFLLAS